MFLTMLPQVKCSVQGECSLLSILDFKYWNIKTQRAILQCLLILRLRQTSERVNNFWPPTWKYISQHVCLGLFEHISPRTHKHTTRDTRAGRAIGSCLDMSFHTLWSLSPAGQKQQIWRVNMSATGTFERVAVGEQWDAVCKYVRMWKILQNNEKDWVE